MTILSASIAILCLTLANAFYDLVLSSWLFAKSKKDAGDNLLERINAKQKRDKWVAGIFLGLISALSVLSIWEAAMKGEVTKDEFVALEARVVALENHIPPGTIEAVQKQLGKIATDLETRVTKEDLKKTKEELEELIETVAKRLKQATNKPQTG